MSSEFTELCGMFGLSPNDPDAIDKIIDDCSRSVSDDEFYEYDDECNLEDYFEN